MTDQKQKSEVSIPQWAVDAIVTTRDQAADHRFQANVRTVTLLHLTNGAALVAVFTLLSSAFVSDQTLAANMASLLYGPSCLFAAGAIFAVAAAMALASEKDKSSYYNWSLASLYSGSALDVAQIKKEQKIIADKYAPGQILARRVRDASFVASLLSFLAGALWAISTIAESAPVS